MFLLPNVVGKRLVMMTLKSLAMAVAIAFATVSGAAAATLDFDFSFGYGDNTVSGTLYGLTDNAYSSVSYIELHDTPIGPKDFADSLIIGGFEVEDGEIVGGGILDVTYGLPTFGLFGGDHLSGIALFDDASDFQIVIGQASFTPVSAVPLPAGALLLLSGIGGVAALKRRKKHAA